MLREMLWSVWADMWEPVTLPRWLVLTLAAAGLQMTVRALIELLGGLI